MPDHRPITSRPITSRLMMLGLIWIVGSTMVSATAESQLNSAIRVDELNDATFKKWQSRLQAKPQELKWQQLPWLTSFHEGLQKASTEDKPLLLWVMNGHPFGCT